MRMIRLLLLFIIY